jgi:hypothetical protein
MQRRTSRSQRLTPRIVLVIAALSSLLRPCSAAAQPEAPETVSKPSPRVILDRLDLPPGLAKTRYEKQLRKVLASEARKADWGAGASSTIEFRFKVESLTVTHEGRTVHVRCSAHGSLPRGRPAHSQLSYGGDPQKQSELVQQVLSIVARGVVTRLAEMERVRRGQQTTARVRVPAE